MKNEEMFMEKSWKHVLSCLWEKYGDFHLGPLKSKSNDLS